MEKITFCIPVKSNLRYLKACIASIRENASRQDHDIVIYVDEDTDGTCKWLDSLNDPNLTYYKNTSGKLLGIGKGYDFCIEKSKTSVFMIFHADMMLGKLADQKAFECLGAKRVVCCTRVEPPLHPPGPEKIVINFGLWPEEDITNGFCKKEFNAFVEMELGNTKITHGCFAPWMMYKEDFNAIGGHDRIFHSYHEDSDMFNRMVLNGYTLTQPWNALVYHLTCRAGVFENGIERKSQRVLAMQHRSLFDFVRKWGTPIIHDDLMMPIVKPKYDVGFVVRGCNNYDGLQQIEPWCSTLYVDDIANGEKLIRETQPHTSFNLKTKLQVYDAPKNNDIIVYFDLQNLGQSQMNFLMQLPDVLAESGEVGEMEHDIFRLEIKTLNTYNDKLINATDPWYIKQLV